MTITRLALEDGSIFTGAGFGADAAASPAVGEVVFNTAMSGYQEALTDPSYRGQILVMTAPLIGNYGIAADDDESGHPQVAGVVVRELARRHSSHRAVRDLSGWLAGHGVPGLQGIDTRALVRLVRTGGAMRGAISSDPGLDDAALVEAARSAPLMSGCDLASTVSPRACSEWSEGLGEWGPPPELLRRGERPLRVFALDCGAKRAIYRNLVSRGCAVHVSPHSASAEEIRDFAPDGLFISNGPGDPAAVTGTVELLRSLLGEYPMMGICLGHQLLALALGATTYKLKFGHRGANQPVRSVLTGRVEITSQNHGFCVEPQSLRDAGCEITHVHLNDGTVAGFRHQQLRLFAVQYHPEASPGPHDSGYLFDEFVGLMEGAAV